MRSPLPSPPTWPSRARLPSRRASVVTKLWPSVSRAADQVGASLLATRSTPPRSDIAHWLSRKPGTVPLAR